MKVMRWKRGLTRLDFHSTREETPVNYFSVGPLLSPRDQNKTSHPAYHYKAYNQKIMSRSTDPGHFFQTDASESSRARKAAKSGNKNGKPIVLKSKILNAIADPFSSSCLYIAESAGCVRKVNVEVGMEVII